MLSEHACCASMTAPMTGLSAGRTRHTIVLFRLVSNDAAGEAASAISGVR
jgi:hypothetical protein